ncbi:glutamine--fructose-6-phosphate transaminase (isomerizing) [Halobacteria archaeon AArc-m2/3/4]|uniref:Glutamine--fructose-6-phosphate aminotransferase [isomerizing] n=1 Tax=Natronoglomus mannanivorans TaxID=2979990 RepID=A0AAP2YY54_9EURY|nr:glutamine--fructose-6-phosphate transaminase (isomerizing) [Halobacteria archaeon AArc-xg1-1]MCU4973216.1 glutamine--fructose-6-phosphate transaminase (isomerizing) [Halobacteria archaeon AArc-m2/3/4]
MCGIIGYTGGRSHAPDDGDVLDVLMTGLSGLEYRGYDSAGVALADSSLSVHKRQGEVSALEDALPDGSVGGRAGIGHTRWSTHGPPSDANAHPHTDCTGTVAVVHNGIIENYQVLREELETAGHTFESETDTEVIPHLIEDALEAGADRESAFRRAVNQLEGSYAVAAVFCESETVYAARHESPLVLGIGEDGHYLASDVPAFIEYTDRVIYLDDGEFATVSPSGVVVTDDEGTVVETSIETIEWDPEDAGKSGYDHYMLKEIYEQPQAIRKCLRERVNEMEGTITVDDLADLESSGPVQFVACGTSYHAALYGAQLLRERGIPAQCFLASEYDVDSIPVSEETLVVGVTQSGETADTMSALRGANRVGATTVALTNVVGSSAARECDHAMYIRAGPEIGVAATKTFASQQVALALFSSVISGECSQAFVEALRDLPDQVQSVLDNSTAREVAQTYEDADAYFFIGRGYNAPVALEGALKMKEITYKHAEGFAAGELKHGPLALVTDRTPVFAMVSDDGTAAKTLGNVKEVEARDAPVVAVTDSRETVDQYADFVLEVPETHPVLMPILANIQLQLVSYWIANRLGRSIDKPRNLAKSVTVE